MLDRLLVAAANSNGQPGATNQNLEQIAHHASRAAAQQAKLVLFPELSLTGFLPNHPEGSHAAWLREALQLARNTAERLDGPAVKALTRAAQQIGIYIAAGILEDAGNVLYNTHILVGPQGLAGYWRKMHVPMFEMPFYNGGPSPTVVDTPLGRLGVNICFDALMPESTRLLAVQNVEIVLYPFAADPPPVTPQGWSAWAGPALRSRSQENGVFGIATNYIGSVSAVGVGQTFPGGAMITGPRGEVLAEQGEGDLLLQELDAADLRAARAEPEYLFRFRRPELYGSLAR
ncbi:MAG TPA: carbon-nitrogen hydrolase family protein [Bryobacteraceae bacterium]|nr:carbon-nitrogen hydrolase family protein [Bryobacteraceae bacterium]